MLIGIDMIGVQSPESGGRLSGRYARQLAAALLESDPDNRYILYLHEGMATDRVPARKDVSRVVLAPIAAAQGPARRRLATQRIIDRNPDNLDWLILLDPFDEHYGGPPPEAPVSGLKVASVVVDLSASAVNERDLQVIGRHDLILAVSDAVAAAGRRRLGGHGARVRAIEMATSSRPDPMPGQAPMTMVPARELAELGIHGPFLLADASAGMENRDLFNLLDTYADLPVGIRSGHQLVIMGHLDNPNRAYWRLHDRGCDDGFLLPGPVGESAVEALFDRCTAYLTPLAVRNAPQALAEALGHGVAIVASDSDCDRSIAGDAALAADPADVLHPLRELLADASLRRDLRRRAGLRAAAFPWETAIDSILTALGELAPAELGRRRIDGSHASRPRIAYFPSLPATAGRIDLGEWVPAALAHTSRVDLYLDAADLDRVVGLPVDFGGFDARLFGRNDAMLDYQAVIYEAADPGDVDRLGPLLARRPGIVDLVGRGWHDPDLVEAARSISAIFRAGSRPIVSCPWLAWLIRETMPEHAGRWATIPRDEAVPADRDRAGGGLRGELGLADDAFVIGRIHAGPDDGTGLAVLHAFKDLARSQPGPRLVLVEGETAGDTADLLDMAARLNIGDRVITAQARDRVEYADLMGSLDLAIQTGSPEVDSLLGPLKADVPSIRFGCGSPFPAGVIRGIEPDWPGNELVESLRGLAGDVVARAAMVQSARDHFLGTAESAPEATLWAEAIERCSAEIPRIPGRRRNEATARREVPASPHFPRAASTSAAVAHRSR
ncbi:glycosyltransferase [Tundrisphaera sp. TA3]|uniref:glycosyltransferase n=1 Tax=Tundrisphaera sp. TA3 TaxID=3435775 RepID=UPI003EBB737D